MRKGAEELNNTIDDQLFEGMKLELYFNVKTSTLSKLKNLHSIALDRFRRSFESNEIGMRRNWKVIEEAEITSLFKQAKTDVFAILDELESCVFPSFLNGIFKVIKEPEKKLFQKEDVLGVKQRLEEDMNHIVEKVYNLKYVVFADSEPRRIADSPDLAVGGFGVLYARQHSGMDAQPLHSVPFDPGGRSGGLPLRDRYAPGQE
jgi:hypothetical protein